MGASISSLAYETPASPSIFSTAYPVSSSDHPPGGLGHHQMRLDAQVPEDFQKPDAVHGAGSSRDPHDHSCHRRIVDGGPPACRVSRNCSKAIPRAIGRQQPDLVPVGEGRRQPSGLAHVPPVEEHAHPDGAVLAKDARLEPRLPGDTVRQRFGHVPAFAFHGRGPLFAGDARWQLDRGLGHVDSPPAQAGAPELLELALPQRPTAST